MNERSMFLTNVCEKEIIDIYIILDGLEGDTRIYCQRC